MRLPYFSKGHMHFCQEVQRKAFPLGHARRLNASGRQTCCKKCHTCLNDLREVLDGELWCDTCQTYR
jgi:hypothetical protein